MGSMAMQRSSVASVSSSMSFRLLAFVWRYACCRMDRARNCIGVHVHNTQDYNMVTTRHTSARSRLIFKGLSRGARCCLSSVDVEVLASVLSRVRWLFHVESDSSNGTDRLDAATRMVCWRESDGCEPTPSELVSRTRHPTLRGAAEPPSMPLEGWAWLPALQDGPKHPACMVVRCLFCEQDVHNTPRAPCAR